MAPFKLIVGNKNLSSWSLRPYLVLKHTGAAFEEEVIPLDRPDTRQSIRQVSPSGRVPCLVHEGNAIWDSLAICEYLNEIFPDANLWPTSRVARAAARSIVCEMHSGFQALRTNMPMNITAQRHGEGRAEGVEADIRRIQDIWRDARERFGAGGRFLFGDFTIADAFFAPVVTRFRTYGVDLEPHAAAYADAIWSLPAMREWEAGARAEVGA